MADGQARPQFKYSHQAGAVTTTQIKQGPGVLRAVTMNSIGATVSQITLADNNAATTTNPIAIIQPVTSSTVVPTTAVYDIAFLNGLTFTMSTAANTQDVTVIYI